MRGICFSRGYDIRFKSLYIMLCNSILKLFEASFIILKLFFCAEKPYFLWPALNLIGLGTNMLRFSGFLFADLVPEYRATVITTYSSAYSISTTFFLLMQVPLLKQSFSVWQSKLLNLSKVCTNNVATSYLFKKII